MNSGGLFIDFPPVHRGLLAGPVCPALLLREREQVRERQATALLPAGPSGRS